MNRSSSSSSCTIVAVALSSDRCLGDADSSNTDRLLLDNMLGLDPLSVPNVAVILVSGVTRAGLAPLEMRPAKAASLWGDMAAIPIVGLIKIARARSPGVCGGNRPEFPG